MKKLSLIFDAKVYFLLAVIVIFSFAIRVYKIDSDPPSLTWDEAAVGYNAWTIANFGKDEYGKNFPLYFRSFGEDKQPVHIYTTAIFVKLFGLSEFSTRIAAAIFGSLNVLIIFFLARLLLKSDLVGIFSSLFLNFSPQNIFFSRFNHEANFALFFFMLGFLFFLKAIKKKNWLLPIAFLFFFMSAISYHAAEIIVPLIMLSLFVLYFRRIIENKMSILTTSLLLGGAILFGIYNPNLFGVARYNQTVQGNNEIEKTEIFQMTHNYFIGRVGLVLEQYVSHFDFRYLFISGDKNSRLSSQGAGEFYIIDALFLVLGVIYLIRKKSREGILVLIWALFGPLPSALFGEAHAGRAVFMMGSWQIIAALGLYSIINFSKTILIKRVIVSLFLLVLLISFVRYFGNYLTEFPKRYSIDWQYGMKQIVEYVEGHQEYPYFFMTNLRSQPYIFFLYYLKTPLPDYLSSVVYNPLENKSSNTVSSYDRYYFSGWDPVRDLPNHEALYILTPSEYDGLMYRSSFNIKKVIYYPNGTTAYYIVSTK